MKILILFFLILSACSSLNSTSHKSSEFKLRPHRAVTLKNGLKIYFIEDNTLPRISFQLLVRAGSTHDPKDLAGLNAMTAALLEQGTQNKNALALAEELGQLGTEFSAAPGNDYSFFSADALSKDRSQLLNLFGDIMMKPAFSSTEVNRIRSQFKAQIAKKIDNASHYASEKFEEFLYGEHPYARDVRGNLGSLNRIRKSSIIKHYLAWYRPNNAILAVVGQFPKVFEVEVTNVFEKWAQRELKDIPSYQMPSSSGLQMQLVSKPGLQQTQIRLGQIGVTRKTPEFMELRLANEILGGGMSSRLMQRVRDNLGLTYGISSGFEFRKEKGPFVISTFTKNESVAQTIDETLNVYNEFITNGVKAKELEAAKAQLIGQFPRALETADRFAYNLLILDFYSIPFTYLTNYISNVEKISVEDVNSAIKKHLSKDNVKITVFGDQKQILKQLSKFNPQVIN